VVRCRVLVVGAGPAGGDLARQLAAHGEDVLLVERLPDLRRAAFSSAALPLDALERFGLPASVVAHRWSGWELLGPCESCRRWQGGRPQGVVLDFGALREWLVGEAQRWGARVWLGHRALACHQEADGLHTVLRQGDGGEIEVHSDWVIDATGQERSLLGDPPAGGPGAETLVSGVGLEWLVQVPSACWERWSDRLAFCLGSDWVAQGYGWVFPMQTPRLKLGVCRLLDPSRDQPPLGGVLERLIERLLAPAERQAMAVLDRHGGLIRSSIRRREPHRRGRLVGLGDAVSTANLLGGEGIRHALMSSRVLAPLLLEELRHPPGGCCVDRYPLELRRALGWRWSISGRLARRTWLGLHGSAADRRLGALLTSLEQEGASALSDLLFGYRFERYGIRALPYLLGLR
jgi:flavin-dependent dehydrogenase